MNTVIKKTDGENTITSGDCSSVNGGYYCTASGDYGLLWYCYDCPYCINYCNDNDDEDEDEDEEFLKDIEIVNYCNDNDDEYDEVLKAIEMAQKIIKQRKEL